jgi:hypothetical protein
MTTEFAAARLKENAARFLSGPHGNLVTDTPALPINGARHSFSRRGVIQPGSRL